VEVGKLLTGGKPDRPNPVKSAPENPEYRGKSKEDEKRPRWHVAIEGAL
jgi:hypothetical protein